MNNIFLYFIGGDLNGDVEKDSAGFKRVHGVQRYGVKNE